MPLTLTTPPALEPVLLADAKAHLKIDGTDDDALIGALITAARARAEWHTGRALVTQSWTLHLDGWPRCGVVEIPLPPLQSVSAVTLTARDDSTTTLDPALYTVDTASAPARLGLKPGTAPPADLRRIDAIAIAFTAGYGGAASDVPPLIRQAILELTAFLYEHRGEASAEMPATAQALLAPFVVFKL